MRTLAVEIGRFGLCNIVDATAARTRDAGCVRCAGGIGGRRWQRQDGAAFHARDRFVLWLRSRFLRIVFHGCLLGFARPMRGRGRVEPRACATLFEGPGHFRELGIVPVACSTARTGLCRRGAPPLIESPSTPSGRCRNTGAGCPVMYCLPRGRPPVKHTAGTCRVDRSYSVSRRPASAGGSPPSDGPCARLRPPRFAR